MGKDCWRFQERGNVSSSHRRMGDEWIRECSRVPGKLHGAPVSLVAMKLK